MSFDIKKSEESWLLKWGMIFVPLSFVTALLYTSFVDADKILFPPTESTESIFILLFIFGFSFLIAPIYEEFFFRGFLLKNKWLVFLGHAGIFLMLVIVNNLISWLFYFLFLVLFFIWHMTKRKKGEILTILLISNGLLFQSLHHSWQDYQYPLIIILSISGIGFVFIAQWLVLNYNIWFAIFFHAVWNFLFISLIFIGQQFPDKTWHTIENKKLRIEWQETELLGGNKRLLIENQYNITYKKYLLENIIDPKNEETEQLKKHYIQIETDRRYNIKLTIKDPAILKDYSQYAYEVLQLLEEESLLLKK